MEDKKRQRRKTKKINFTFLKKRKFWKVVCKTVSLLLIAFIMYWLFLLLQNIYIINLQNNALIKQGQLVQLNKDTVVCDGVAKQNIAKVKEQNKQITTEQINNAYYNLLGQCLLSQGWSQAIAKESVQVIAQRDQEIMKQNMQKQVNQVQKQPQQQSQPQIQPKKENK